MIDDGVLCSVLPRIATIQQGEKHHDGTLRELQPVLNVFPTLNGWCPNKLGYQYAAFILRISD
jgi:hypothetical protein